MEDSKPIQLDHPLVSFHFSVSFKGGALDGIDAGFRSVSGLTSEFMTESIKEGGENSFEHVIPMRKKYANLILKRGMLDLKGVSEITKWYKNAFDNYQFEPVNLDVCLLDENHKPLLKWQIQHAIPIKWQIGDFDAEKGEILIETFELNYNTFKLTKP